MRGRTLRVVVLNQGAFSSIRPRALPAEPNRTGSADLIWWRHNHHCLTAVCNVQPHSAKNHGYLGVRCAEVWPARLISDSTKNLRSGLRSALGGSAWGSGKLEEPKSRLSGPLWSLPHLEHVAAENPAIKSWTTESGP